MFGLREVADQPANGRPHDLVQFRVRAGPRILSAQGVVAPVDKQELDGIVS